MDQNQEGVGEIDNLIALLKIGLQSRTDLMLPLVGQVKILLLQPLDVRRDFNPDSTRALLPDELPIPIFKNGSEFGYGSGSWLIEVPLNQESIGGKTGMEEAGGLAVIITIQSPGDTAQFPEVEIGILPLEKIVGPGDEVVASPSSLLPLGQLQSVADSPILVLGKDCKHVGVEDELLIMEDR